MRMKVVLEYTDGTTMEGEAPTPEGRTALELGEEAWSIEQAKRRLDRFKANHPRTRLKAVHIKKIKEDR